MFKYETSIILSNCQYDKIGAIFRIRSPELLKEKLSNSNCHKISVDQCILFLISASFGLNFVEIVISINLLKNNIYLLQEVVPVQ